MSTEISIRPDQSGFDDTQTAALESLGIAEAPKGDQQLFLHVAQRSGLDPFARQIYLIPRWDGSKRKNKWTIQTSIDGLRVIRDRIGKFEGLTTEWCGEDGVWRDVWLSKAKPAAARVSVYVKGFQVPVRGIALWAEYVQTTKDGNVTSMWNGKSTVMIAKCAEAIAYRQAFPQDFSGLYVAEEMPAAGVEQDHDGGQVSRLMQEDNRPKRDSEPEPPNMKGRGHASETDVPRRPEKQATPTGRSRPAGSRAESASTGTGNTDDVQTRSHVDVFQQWAEAVTHIQTMNGLIAAQADAAKRGVLDIAGGDGRTIETVLLDKRTELQDVARQADAGEPEPAQEYIYKDDQVPF